MSPTQVSQLHQTMSSTSLVADAARWQKQQVRAIHCLWANVMGKRFGNWSIPYYTLDLAETWGGVRLVPAMCVTCCRWCLVLKTSLLSGKSTGCVTCRRPAKYREVPPMQCLQLQQRYNSLTERVKANKYSSRTYAGVENEFGSCEAFVKHIWAKYPKDTYKGWEIDRISTDDHYAPGNVRVVRREQNAQSRRVNRMWQLDGERISASLMCRKFFPEMHKSTVMIWHRDQRDVPWMVARYASRFGTSSTLDHALDLHAQGRLCRIAA